MTDGKMIPGRLVRIEISADGWAPSARFVDDPDIGPCIELAIDTRQPLLDPSNPDDVRLGEILGAWVTGGERPELAATINGPWRKRWRARSKQWRVPDSDPTVDKRRP